MRLLELNPRFLRVTHAGYGFVNSLSEAQGVSFDCPVGHGHRVLVWFSDCDVPPSTRPGPGRWRAYGTGLDDLTLAPSVALGPSCLWHGHIENGSVR